MNVEFFENGEQVAYARVSRFVLSTEEGQRELADNFAIQCNHFGWPITFPEPRINDVGETEYPVIRFFVAPNTGEIRYEVPLWEPITFFDPFGQSPEPQPSEPEPEAEKIKPSKRAGRESGM